MNKFHSLVRLRFGVVLATLVAIATLLPMQLHAQTFFGSVVGTVTDTSDAVVPGATVTITNLGTNESHTGTTDAAGEYRFVNLVPANYKIAVEAASYKSVVRQPVTVAVSNTTRIDTVMTVGATTEIVEVTTQAALLQTESASLSQEVSGTAVQQMPLNGRNSMNLISLVAGVVPQYSSQGTTSLDNFGHTTAQGWGNYQIGGGIAGLSAEFIDGAPDNIFGGPAGNYYGNYVALVPTQDVVQEFRVSTNDTSAEFGRFSGGVVNMTTKSGSNAFHVSAYEFLRNNVFNANDFFSSLKGKARAKWNQNQFGVTAGGPVRNDKLFYFFSWEGFNSRIGSPQAVNVPTQDQQNGKFVGYIKNPLNNGNVTYWADNAETQLVTPNATGSNVAVSQIVTMDAAAAVMRKYYPLPNQPSTASTNWYNVPVQGNNANQYTGRLDYTLSDKQRLFGRYSYWFAKDLGRDTFNSANGFHTGSAGATNRVHQTVLGDTFTINPTTVLDVRASYLRLVTGDTSPNLGEGNLAQFGSGWSPLVSQVAFNMLPSPWFSGLLGLGSNFVPMSHQTLSENNVYALSASLTKIKARHTVKFGGEGRLMDTSFLGTNPSNAAGYYYFDTGYTGNEWAAFLLGYMTSAQIGTDTKSGTYNYYQGYYLTDSWQLKNKLTLDLGIRWELPGGIAERKNRATVLLPTTKEPTSGVVGTLALVDSSLYSSRSVIDIKHKLFAPRVGFVYRLNKATVIRGAYGINHMPIDASTGMLPYSSPIISARTTTTNGVVPTYVLAEPFKPYSNKLNKPAGRASNFMQDTFGQGITGGLPNAPAAYGQQWNLSVGRQMKGDWMVEIGYVRSLSVHAPTGNGGISIDQLPDKYLAGVQNLFDTERAAGNSSAESNAVALGLSELPFTYSATPGVAGYSNVTVANSNYATESYNAMQLKGEKRFRSGGMVIGNFTWSKSLGNADDLNGNLEHGGGANTNGNGWIQNYNNLKSERSLLSFDVRARAVISYVIDLPFGKGQKVGSGVTGVAEKLISGWSANGIATLQSGFPLYLVVAGGNDLTRHLNAGQLRPNYTPNATGCNGNRAASASGSLTSLVRSAKPVINTACFANPGLFSYGNEPRVDPTLKAQGIDNWDFALQKTTTIKERVNVQFRAEAFNIANRTQLFIPNLQQDSTTFGVISSQANQPRLIQVSLRLNY